MITIIITIVVQLVFHPANAHAAGGKGPAWQPLFDNDTLEGWTVTRFGAEGRVFTAGGHITLGIGDGCTGITWNKEFPRLDYEVKLQARRAQGHDFFCGLTFPVDSSCCTLIVGGWGGSVVGLSCIDGLDASENETASMRRFVTGRWYEIHLRVTGEAILAWIDGAKVVDFDPRERILSVRPEVELSRPFGICSWNTTAHLRSIVFRPL